MERMTSLRKKTVGTGAALVLAMTLFTTGCSSDNGSTNPGSPTAGPGGAGWAKYEGAGRQAKDVSVTPTNKPGEPPVVGSHPSKASTGEEKPAKK